MGIVMNRNDTGNARGAHDELLDRQREDAEGGEQDEDDGDGDERLVSIDAPDGIDHGRPSEVGYRRRRDFTPIRRPVQVKIW